MLAFCAKAEKQRLKLKTNRQEMRLFMDSSGVEFAKGDSAGYEFLNRADIIAKSRAPWETTQGVEPSPMSLNAGVYGQRLALSSQPAARAVGCT